MSERFKIQHGDCLEIMRAMPTKKVRLTITSPPYPGKLQRYGEGKRGVATDEEWVEWMKPRVLEMVRVTDGMVGIVANGRVKDGCYQPAVEALLVDLWRAGVKCERTTIWHKNSPPNRKDWFGNDWEPVIWFYADDVEPSWNWESIATEPRSRVMGWWSSGA